MDCLCMRGDVGSWADELALMASYIGGGVWVGWVCVVVRRCRGVDGVVEGTTSALALLGHWWLLVEGPAGAVVWE